METMQTSQEEAPTPRWDWIQDQSNPHNGPVGLSYPGPSTAVVHP